MRLLVIGASGQVGGAVLRAGADRGHTMLGGYISRVPDLAEERTARIDKTDTGTFGAALDHLSPDWIVDTGALHNVDFCENHPEEALATNRDGSGALARAAAERGVGVLFISTDFVFDGSGHPPYRETDDARPLSVYGRSKLEGEIAVLAASHRNLIVRPSVVYSWVPTSVRTQSASQKPVNFGTWVIDQLTGGKEIRIVQDQIASPTLAEDLAEGILSLIDHRAEGLFHAAGGTALSRFDFTVEIAKALGLDSGKIVPIKTESLHQVARRPLNSSLDSSRLFSAVGHGMMPLSAALRKLGTAWRGPPALR